MKELARVDILVVLLAGNYPHVVPQKLYNYLALKKPILAVVPPDGRAAQIIKETKSGIVVSPNDSDAIAEHLLELHKSWEKGSMEINIDKEKLAEYRRDLLTKKLATIFDRYMKY
jgi:glycosyltransferase involved in cell wall biosynthesis